MEYSLPLTSSDGTGKLMVSIMAAVAEIERENILAQSMNGRYKKARDGGWNGGLAPYGYKLKDGELVIDEGQAKIVELIFEKYAKTNLLADGIAKWLNEQGYKKSPPNILKENPDRQVEFLKEFSREQICRILDNEIYMGKIAYGKRKNYAVKNQRGVTVTKNQDQYGVYEGKHEAIISEELWNLAHEKRINSGGRSEKKEKEHEYILSTLIRCPECGSPMYGAVNRTKKRKDGTLYKPYYYYKCKNQFGQTGHSCTFKKQIGTRKIDESVRDIIMSLVQSKEFSDAIKSKIGEEIDTEEIENRIEYLKKELHQTEGALRKRSYEKDSLDVDDKHYDKKYEAIQRAEESLYDKQDEIEDAISELQSRIRGIKQNAVTKEKIYQVLVNFNEIYDKMSDREKQELMRLFIERIEIHKEKQPNGLYIKEIHFKFPIKSDGEENCDVIFPSLKDNCGVCSIDV